MASQDSHRPAWLDFGGVLLWMVFLHYVAGPNDFILDDWTNYKDSHTKSWGEIAHKATTHPTRPLSLFFVMGSFRLFGDQPAAFFCLSILCQAVCLGLVCLIGREVGLPTQRAWLPPLVFTLIPGLSENLRWPTLIAGAAACALPAYLAGMLGFVRYLRTGSVLSLAGGAVAYGLGATCYESGLLLPGACLALAWRRPGGSKKLVFIALACAVVFAPMLAWRLTNAFGRGTFMLAAQFTPSFSPSAMLWNLRESIALVFRASGLTHWLDWGSLLLVAAFLVIFLGARWRQMRRSPCPADSAPDARLLPMAAFGLLWAAAGMVPALIGYTASRILYIPMVGVALAGVALVLWMKRPWWLGTVLGILAFMISVGGHWPCQEDWIRSGRAQRGLRDLLVENNDAWRKKGIEVVMVDTRGLLARTTAYQVGSAGFLRGFAIDNMAYTGGVTHPLPVFLDAECGARLEGDEWVWHRPHRPEEIRRADASRVAVVKMVSLLGIGASTNEPNLPADPLP